MSSGERKGAAPGLPRTSDGDQGTPLNDLGVARHKTLAEEIMDDDREVLKELAK